MQCLMESRELNQRILIFLDILLKIDFFSYKNVSDTEAFLFQTFLMHVHPNTKFL